MFFVGLRDLGDGRGSAKIGPSRYRRLTGYHRDDQLVLRRLLRLTLLAPAIVEAILDGRQPEGMTLPGLMEPFPVEWGHQQSEILACNSHLSMRSSLWVFEAIRSRRNELFGDRLSREAEEVCLASGADGAGGIGPDRARRGQ